MSKLESFLHGIESMCCFTHVVFHGEYVVISNVLTRMEIVKYDWWTVRLAEEQKITLSNRWRGMPFEPQVLAAVAHGSNAPVPLCDPLVWTLSAFPVNALSPAPPIPNPSPYPGHGVRILAPSIPSVFDMHSSTRNLWVIGCRSLRVWTILPGWN